VAGALGRWDTVNERIITSSSEATTANWWDIWCAQT
jgi:hypothetical protein